MTAVCAGRMPSFPMLCTKGHIMKPWFIVYETRPNGAIGEFSHSGVSVIADTRESALDQARKHFSDKNLDLRCPVKAYQYEENEE